MERELFIHLDGSASGALPKDRLNRSRFVTALKNQIGKIPADVCSVLSIEGEWGSGKTWVLRTLSEAFSSNEKYHTLHFSPWLFSSQSDLIRNFFAELGGQLDGLDSTTISSLAKDIGRYVKIVSPVRLVPGGELVGELLNAISHVTDQAPEDRFAFQSAAQQKSRIAKSLSALDERVLIFIDDIDRLTDDEILEVFRLIRHVADFPGVIYVIAFDRHRVAEALNGRFSGGENFLDKIIQFSYRLPLPSQGALDKMTQEALMSAIGEGLFGSSEFQGRFYSTYQMIIQPLICIPRDIHRYAAVLPATLTVLNHEVALADVLALEAIRVLSPELHRNLIESADQLTRPKLPGLKADLSHLERLLSLHPEHSHIVESTLRLLFPAPFNSDRYPQWERDRRVAVAHIFEIYLSGTIGPGMVETVQVKQLLDSLEDPSIFAKVLREHISNGTIDDCISRLGQHADQFKGELQIQQLLISVVGVYDTLSESGYLSSTQAWRRVVRGLATHSKDLEEDLLAAITEAPSFSAARHVLEMVQRSEQQSGVRIGSLLLQNSLKVAVAERARSMQARDFLKERDVYEGLLYAADNGINTDDWKEQLASSTGEVFKTVVLRHAPFLPSRGDHDLWSEWRKFKHVLGRERATSHARSIVQDDDDQKNKTVARKLIDYEVRNLKSVKERSSDSEAVKRYMLDIFSGNKGGLEAIEELAWAEHVDAELSVTHLAGVGMALVEVRVPDPIQIYVGSCLGKLSRKGGLNEALAKTKEDYRTGWRLNWLAYLVVHGVAGTSSTDIEHVCNHFRDAMQSYAGKLNELLFNKGFRKILEACHKCTDLSGELSGLLFHDDHGTRVRFLQHFMAWDEHMDWYFDIALAYKFFKQDELPRSIQQIQLHGASSDFAPVSQAYHRAQRSRPPMLEGS